MNLQGIKTQLKWPLMLLILPLLLLGPDTVFLCIIFHILWWESIWKSLKPHGKRFWHSDWGDSLDTFHQVLCLLFRCCSGSGTKKVVGILTHNLIWIFNTIFYFLFFKALACQNQSKRDRDHIVNWVHGLRAPVNPKPYDNSAAIWPLGLEDLHFAFCCVFP